MKSPTTYAKEVIQAIKDQWERWLAGDTFLDWDWGTIIAIDESRHLVQANVNGVLMWVSYGRAAPIVGDIHRVWKTMRGDRWIKIPGEDWRRFWSYTRIPVAYLGRLPANLEAPSLPWGYAVRFRNYCVQGECTVCMTDGTAIDCKSLELQALLNGVPTGTIPDTEIFMAIRGARQPSEEIFIDLYHSSDGSFYEPILTAQNVPVSTERDTWLQLPGQRLRQFRRFVIRGFDSICDQDPNVHCDPVPVLEIWWGDDFNNMETMHFGNMQYPSRLDQLNNFEDTIWGNGADGAAVDTSGGIVDLSSTSLVGRATGDGISLYTTVNKFQFSPNLSDSFQVGEEVLIFNHNAVRDADALQFVPFVGIYMYARIVSYDLLNNIYIIDRELNTALFPNGRLIKTVQRVPSYTTLQLTNTILVPDGGASGVLCVKAQVSIFGSGSLRSKANGFAGGFSGGKPCNNRCCTLGWQGDGQQSFDSRDNKFCIVQAATGGRGGVAEKCPVPSPGEGFCSTIGSSGGGGGGSLFVGGAGLDGCVKTFGSCSGVGAGPGGAGGPLHARTFSYYDNTRQIRLGSGGGQGGGRDEGGGEYGGGGRGGGGVIAQSPQNTISLINVQPGLTSGLAKTQGGGAGGSILILCDTGLVPTTTECRGDPGQIGYSDFFHDDGAGGDGSDGLTHLRRRSSNSIVNAFGYTIQDTLLQPHPVGAWHSDEIDLGRNGKPTLLRVKWSLNVGGLSPRFQLLACDNKGVWETYQELFGNPVVIEVERFPGGGNYFSETFPGVPIANNVWLNLTPYVLRSYRYWIVRVDLDSGVDFILTSPIVEEIELRGVK